MLVLVGIVPSNPLNLSLTLVKQRPNRVQIPSAQLLRHPFTSTRSPIHDHSFTLQLTRPRSSVRLVYIPVTPQAQQHPQRLDLHSRIDLISRNHYTKSLRQLLTRVETNTSSAEYVAYETHRVDCARH